METAQQALKLLIKHEDDMIIKYNEYKKDSKEMVKLYKERLVIINNKYKDLIDDLQSDKKSLKYINNKIKSSMNECLLNEKIYLDEKNKLNKLFIKNTDFISKIQNENYTVEDIANEFELYTFNYNLLLEMYNVKVYNKLNYSTLECFNNISDYINKVLHIN